MLGPEDQRWCAGGVDVIIILLTASRDIVSRWVSPSGNSSELLEASSTTDSFVVDALVC